VAVRARPWTQPSAADQLGSGHPGQPLRPDVRVHRRPPAPDLARARSRAHLGDHGLDPREADAKASATAARYAGTSTSSTEPCRTATASTPCPLGLVGRRGAGVGGEFNRWLSHSATRAAPVRREPPGRPIDPDELAALSGIDLGEVFGWDGLHCGEALGQVLRRTLADMALTAVGLQTTSTDLGLTGTTGSDVRTVSSALSPASPLAAMGDRPP
jgi:hypothetical protein